MPSVLLYALSAPAGAGIGGLRVPTRALALAAIAMLAVGCRTPVGVERVDGQSVHRALTANVLSADKPSSASRQELHRRDLFAQFEKDPAHTLAELDAQLGEPGTENLLFALAELSFAHAAEDGGARYYLAAAVYAYAFLFSEGGAWPPDAFDPRFRVAVNLYNRGLTAGLEVSGRVDLSPRTLALPFGSFELRAAPEEFVWAGRRLEEFVPVAELEVRGIRNRYRRNGIGAPLAGRFADEEGQDVPVEARWVAPQLRVPLAAFVRIGTPLKSLIRGDVVGELELHTADRSGSVRIGERVVPLEYEPTASLAYTLAESRLWDFEIAAYLQGEAEVANTGQRLGMLWPHIPGRIPVVLVHGTASSPARWAELANELLADPLIRDRYELWFFLYNSGNPILHSAGKLRSTLTEVVKALDPEGHDPALRRMVIVGHSQGGILARLLATESGNRFWANVSKVPLEDLELNDETRAMLQEALFFEPLPFVERVVFIATPHRGSYLAGRRLGQIAANLVTLPAGIVSGVGGLLEDNPNKLALRKLDEVPSSVDNMTSSHPFLVSLDETRPRAGVKSHSIVAVRGKGPITSRSDGVVRYTSAHVDWADSEKVVISTHSCQANPDTIVEMRRILRLHLEESPAP